MKLVCHTSMKSRVWIPRLHMVMTCTGDAEIGRFLVLATQLDQ